MVFSASTVSLPENPFAQLRGLFPALPFFDEPQGGASQCERQRHGVFHRYDSALLESPGHPVCGAAGLRLRTRQRFSFSLVIAQDQSLCDRILSAEAGVWNDVHLEVARLLEILRHRLVLGELDCFVQLARSVDVHGTDCLATNVAVVLMKDTICLPQPFLQR